MSSRLELRRPIIEYYAGDPPRRLAIPEGWDLSTRPSVREYVVQRHRDGVAIETDESIRSLVYRDRSLGARAQRQTRHSEDRRFLLDPARVGHDETRVI